ncbi:4Fe-4S binding protein [Fulvivirga sediminis]|uniref:4Fe-4S binding protein n=1 Tax=Fulvivirga sediminis TaxID=2803949 RepID=A0A937F6N3_9BACT|nr:4Fe-4S dicluster domain-containing protein [Fulvivirga sediminis]MBL3655063.1 4Fe-4S binding protein [Fulvivirga sediminis]
MRTLLIQKAGMSLFILACTLLAAMLFINKYEISRSQLETVLSPQDYSKVSNFISPIINHEYTSSISFNADLEKVLDSANQNIQSTFSISNADLEHSIASFPNENITFNNEILASNFANDSIYNYKKDKLRTYTSWMNGKTYENKKVLKEELQGTTKSINGSLNSHLGFDNYKLNTLKLSITRAANSTPIKDSPLLWLGLTIGLGIFAAMLYILPKLSQLPGIKNDGVFQSAHTSRGWIGYSIGVMLILFYVLLYWYPEYMTNWMIMVDPVSQVLNGGPASQWFFYGLLYTIAIIVMGIRMFIKYRHSQYHIIRTSSVMFFQTSFAFLIPEILILLNQPSMDLKNIWPLNYTFFFDYNIQNLINSGGLGLFMLVWGIILVLVAVPVITYFYGKRWYCSWVCGCGGLAETLGDPYRQLSDKSLKSWKIERWMVHAVLAFAIMMTTGTLYTYFTGSGSLLGLDTYYIRSVYGFLIGSVFAGVVGVGFYPVMGSRVWCRFGCPLAAYLGIIQRFKSKFRITTNGGQCISCGNCSTYCEMGIDVRWYAQREQNIVRASCVGCGVCASVCPRGVLKLENDDPDNRFEKPIRISNSKIEVLN